MARTPAKASSKSRRNATPRRGGKAPATGKSTSSRASSTRKTPPGGGYPSPSRLSSAWKRVSLDRKLDILGVGMSLAGLLVLLSMLSSTQSSFSGGVMTGLRLGLGWGSYLLPLALLLIGGWLVLRNFERIPRISLERALGVTLLAVNLLVLLHFFFFPENSEEIYAIAEAGAGGGYLGAVLLAGLHAAFGLGGATIALLAWLLIALALTLDVSVVDLFRWTGRLSAWARNSLGELIHTRSQSEVTSLPPVPAYTPQAPHMADRAAPPQPESHGLGEVSPLPTYAPASASQIQWVLPEIETILEAGQAVAHDEMVDQHRARVIEETLASFGAPARVVEIQRGPTITQFGVEPDFVESRGGRMRVRVGKIAALADDLALALAARTIRIQAPVPGKGYVGIEVPNEEISRVALRDVIESEAFKRARPPLRIALGQDVAGRAVAADLTAMPHLLIAGTTGSGKSVCVNALISCLLLHNTPNDLRLIMVDPKRVELTNYNGIPHLLAPVVVELERVVGALQWVTREMDQRYHKLAQAGTRNIADYNARVVERGERRLPYLIVIIDELADLMMLAPDETERTLTRLAQLARATGIHLVIATQRPSVDVVTGLIKANFPARVAFAVASGVDSRVILDQPGAERLLGRGDMLFQAPDAAAPLRLQGAYVSDAEIQRIVEYWQSFTQAPLMLGDGQEGSIDALPSGAQLKQMPLWEEMNAQKGDPLLDEAIDLARRQGRASVSMLQRRFRIGYTRAARLVETMEEMGIVGPPLPGTGAREVLDYGQAAPPADEV